MDGGVSTYLLTQGVLGVSVLVLGYIIRLNMSQSTTLYPKQDILGVATVMSQEDD